MSKLRKFTLRLAAASVIALAPAGALADPNLPNAGRHKHYIVTPNGDQVAVGPDFCDDPNLQGAFNQFHFNVHRSAVGHNPVYVDTLGPQDGAPGLSNGRGAEMTAGPCD